MNIDQEEKDKDHGSGAEATRERLVFRLSFVIVFSAKRSGLVVCFKKNSACLWAEGRKQ